MSESPVGSQIEELDRQIADTVTRVVRDLQRKLGERVRESSEEVLRRLEQELEADVPKSFISADKLSGLVQTIAPAPPNPAEQLLAAINHVDAETSQADILKALVRESRRFASRTAFFLVRLGEIRGFGGDGWNSVAASLEKLSFAVPDEGAWADLVRGTGAVLLDAEGCRDLARRLDARAGDEGILIPFVLRGQLAGTLYADHLGEGGPPDFASLQLLTHAAAQALETVAFRERGSSPTLRISAAARAEGLPLWHVEEPRAAGPETVAEVQQRGEEAPPSPAAEPPSSEAAEAVAAAARETGAGEATELAEPPEFFEPIATETFEPATAEPEAAAEPEYFEPLEPTAPEGVAAAPEPEPEPEPAPEELSVAPAGVEPEIAVEPEYAEPVLPAPETAAAETSEESIWEDDEPTVIGQKAAESPASSLPTPPIADAGQETVRLDVAQIQGQAVAGLEPSPEFELEPDTPEAAGFELEPEPAPQPPTAVETPPPPAAAPPEIQPPAPTPPPERPSTQVQPPPDMMPTPPPVSHPPSFDSSATVPPATVPPATMSPATVPPAAVSPTPPPPSAVPPASLPSPPPSPKPAAAPQPGTTEVRPPADLDGPGLAFAASQQPAAAAADAGIPAGEEALHEEARRLARLLVSEIKLYNEEVIEEGRMAGNIYSRLKEDIDRSRQMYKERIDPRIKEDYFYQELVQRLAGGDPKLLGM